MVSRILAFILVWLLIPCLSFASGSGTVDDPYTTWVEAAAADCGSTVYLSSAATYKDGTVTISKQCTESTQLFIRCSDGTQEAPGQCSVENFSVNFSGAAWVTVSGFDFHDFVTKPGTYFNNGTNYCTLDNNRYKTWSGFERIVSVGFGSSNNTHNRITRCLFGAGLSGYPISIVYRSITGLGGNTHTIVDRNVFENHEINYPVIQIGDGQFWLDDADYYTLFQKNLIYYCSTDNDMAELIECKTSSNQFIGNVFFESGGQLSLRDGSDNLVLNNMWLTTTLVAGQYLHGVRVSGANHKIINNLFQAQAGSDCVAGDNPVLGISFYWGGAPVDGESSGAPQVTNVLVANNTILNSCSGAVQFYKASDLFDLPPTGNTVINNLAESGDLYWAKYLFGSGHIAGTNTTWITNRGHTNDPNFTPAEITEGVIDAGGFVITQQKTGLGDFNWYYPVSYTDGTAHPDVTVDIEYSGRGSPPKIGCDEPGGSQRLIPVGPTWTGGYTIPDRTSVGSRGVTFGAGVTFR